MYTMEKAKIQKLYDACTSLFCSSRKQTPSFQQIQCLRNILDTIEGIDVGIDEISHHQFSSVVDSTHSSIDACHEHINGRDVEPEITYIHIYECDDFSIGVFCFTQGAKLPLHDHPGMTVLSKVLYGSLHIKAYDWLKMSSSHSKTVGFAKTVGDGVFESPCEASALFPTTGGNIHSLEALTPSAILDVLYPPYSEEFGRPSKYYSHTPMPSLPGYVILKEIDLPDDLVVRGEAYLGPQIITRFHKP
ncbi:hypothetical protein Sjap_010594 [Stephania japonica]|uniref:cysteine dioxygenase n=1 Tax=Stephania japonica TaxID=461633 RepID=A0AAP0J9F4_9MAGN